MTKIFIKTYGCSMNQSDSETMKAILIKKGHEITSKKEAELIIFNTCTVKNPTQSKFFDEMEKEKKEKKVVITGCIAQAQPQLFKNQTLVGVEQLSKIDEAVNDELNNKHNLYLRRSDEPRVKLPSVRTNKITEIIPINKGCNGNCAFCKTKTARGILKSFPLRDIVSRANHAINEGVKEIWLTSQDTGAYGIDINTSLPILINKIIDNEGKFLLRIGMTNPEYVLKYEKELIILLKSSKVYTFLHVPVQSGNNEVLKRMNRPYNINEVKECLLRMKKEIPDLTLSTDIICGFPGETEEQWQNTMDFVKEINFPIINISKFYKRPGTKAARMKQLSSKTIKKRSKEITKWFINKPPEIISEEQEVLINEHNERGQSIGKTINYRQVIIEENSELGNFIKVKIFSSNTFYYKGKLLK